jgi:hypothetical protein
VEIQEEEKGKEMISPSKVKYYKIWSEMKRTDTQTQTLTKKDKLCQGTQ